MHRSLLFHKPYGVLTQFTRPPDSDARTLRDFIPVQDVYAVGRLDRDSEGLLLLTTDGKLQHRLSHPKFEHPKTYWVQVDGVPDAEALRRLAEGVVIQDWKTKPARVRQLEAEPSLPPRDPPIRYRKSIPTAWIELIVTEGRNRQVRRMTAAVGLPTLRLVRVAIGPLTLGDLLPGRWRDLAPIDLSSLQGD